ncbi:MAG: TRAPP subunit bet5 [Piccolia ochrophora]|nr:MAG: TRAPP subunit bet5 [Piccolia ochrophora]
MQMERLDGLSQAECIYSRLWNPQPNAPRPPSQPGAHKPLSAQDDAKLIFGTIFSLRNIVRKLGGDDDNFISFRTGHYKMHYYETPTNIKFVMLSDTKTNNLRIVLHQIYVNLYVEYVVKNPLSPVEHPGGVGVANELFELALDSFISGGL